MVLVSSSKSHPIPFTALDLVPGVVSQDAVKIYLELYVAAPSWAVDALKLEPRDLQEGRELGV